MADYFVITHTTNDASFCIIWNKLLQSAKKIGLSQHGTACTYLWILKWLHIKTVITKHIKCQIMILFLNLSRIEDARNKKNVFCHVQNSNVFSWETAHKNQICFLTFVFTMETFWSWSWKGRGQRVLVLTEQKTTGHLFCSLYLLFFHKFKQRVCYRVLVSFIFFYSVMKWHV